MAEPQATDIGKVVGALDKIGHPPDSDDLGKIARVLSGLFGVDPDEVAILGLSAKSKSLKFIIPEKLAAVGSIPLSSATALAARTARERKPEVMNTFSTTRHASVFEGVPLGREPGETIQKIMSAPILDGTVVSGVVQISRKGFSLSNAGPDFDQKDLRRLVLLSPSLDRFLKLFSNDL